MGESEVSQAEIDALLNTAKAAAETPAESSTESPSEAPESTPPPPPPESPAKEEPESAPAPESAAKQEPESTPAPESAAKEEPESTPPSPRPESAAKEEVVVQSAQLPQLQRREQPAQDGSIDFILDVPVSITVELGRTTMVIKDVLNLGAGAVIELNRLAGEPVDLFINNKLVAHGEVVVVNENFGVKVIDIVSAAQRIRDLA